MAFSFRLFFILVISFFAQTAFAQPTLDDLCIYDESTKSFVTPKSKEQLTKESIEKTWTALKEKSTLIPDKVAFEALKKSYLADCDYAMKKEKMLTKRTLAMLSQWTQMEAPLAYIAPPENEEWTPSNLTEEIKKQLIMEAQKARTHSYSPYSHFPVGAVLLTKKGALFHGCNVENAAYGSTICAERSAMMHAASKINQGISLEYEKEIIAVGLVLRSGGSPCGGCRQVLNEANPRMAVIMGDVDGSMKDAISLEKLLPDSFGPENLR